MAGVERSGAYRSEEKRGGNAAEGGRKWPSLPEPGVGLHAVGTSFYNGGPGTFLPV